jgi:uncharacterized protein (TIGR00299 family) protein
MKTLFLDTFSGISGDMFLGAMLDLGLSEQKLRGELAKIQLPKHKISVRRIEKQEISATKFDVDVPKSEHDHRHLTEILQLIEQSSLSATVKKRAANMFRRLGEAEAKIHNVPLEKIYFHEVGAVDSIIDIVGAAIAIEELGIETVHAAPPPLGSGFVETAHGRFPVPAPATLELLKNFPVAESDEKKELVTPTGALILTEFCQTFGPMPAMRVEKIGYGAGTIDLDRRPNLLRAVLGEKIAVSTAETDTISVIETNIDDMNPEIFSDVVEKCLDSGALDVFFTPIFAKKNRPATQLTVLCERGDAEKFAELLLRHTTTFGVRISQAKRRKLEREIVKVSTKFGEIDMKIGRLNGTICNVTPEFSSCQAAAAAHGVPVKDVYRAALQKAEEIHD